MNVNIARFINGGRLQHWSQQEYKDHRVIVLLYDKDNKDGYLVVIYVYGTFSVFPIVFPFRITDFSTHSRAKFLTFVILLFRTKIIFIVKVFIYLFNPPNIM